jgi:hypothetical protein
MKNRILFSWIAGTLMLAGQAFAQSHVRFSMSDASTADVSASARARPGGSADRREGPRARRCRRLLRNMSGGRQRVPAQQGDSPASIFQ